MSEADQVVEKIIEHALDRGQISRVDNMMQIPFNTLNIFTSSGLYLVDQSTLIAIMETRRRYGGPLGGFTYELRRISS